jgi:hypothetical protein
MSNQGHERFHTLYLEYLHVWPYPLRGSSSFPFQRGEFVEIGARASKQDNELGRPVNLGRLHSLQCNPICINRELHTE